MTTDENIAGVAAGTSWRGVYFDGRSARAHDVQVRFRNFSIEIVSSDQAVRETWPFEGMRLVNTARDGTRIELGHAANAAARLRIEGPGVIDAFRANASGLFRADRAQTAKVVGGLMAIAAVLMLAVYQLPQIMVPLIPDNYAKRLGRGLVAQVTDMFGGVCTERAGQDALQKMTERLLAGSEIRHRIEVRVINTEIVNALAAPGGHVLVFDGLIQEAESSEEVAGVLAHELGHVIHKHSLESLSRSLGAQFVLTSMMGGMAGDTSSLLLSTSFSRDAEREADDAAVSILSSAGVDAEPFAAFFDRLSASGLDDADEEDGDEETDEGTSGYSAGGWLKVGNLLSTHPSSPERAQLVRESGVSGGTPVLTPHEWQALRGICSGAE